ncbi:MAG: transcription elongation factor GreA [Candidatus Taylorbacteria bacterium RIFOXYD2_FULL_36_9]|uniref:Transcription elongation factor GreA n=1 Tax=Candidatus Taylorbacteria bacterium RIFOXYD2_FULL_36_9 TaxID=1802338 RepID=A0A1G2PHZ1_9BACT|nr:MAG: transcription elongation factor GreA [Candidatus Taylorbacteria bacterium RIFOXYD2_FULL_36_9]
MKGEREYLTKDKFDELKKELDELKTVKRKEVAESLDYARGLGDLSENAEYHEARELQANIEDRIAKLESIMKNSTIVSRESPQGEYVRIGSTVIVEKQGGKVQQKFKIVGSEETDMLQGKLSNRCPLGVAILGKKAGDSFSFNSPAGIMIYKVITIE